MYPPPPRGYFGRFLFGGGGIGRGGCVRKRKKEEPKEKVQLKYISKCKKGITDKLRLSEYVRSKFGILQGGISFPERVRGGGTVWFLDRYQDRPMRYDKPKL
jgi:hypothetical protein